MSKQPVRLAKQEPNTPLINLNWVLMHPVVLLLAVLIVVILCSALVFAVTGGSAVESGGMRNFIANGA